MKIVFAEPLGVKTEILEQIKQDFESLGHEFTFYSDRKESEYDIIERAKDADILTVSNIPITKNIIEACENLKLINVAFTGYDHIDLEACKKNNISVCNASGYSTTAVAELCIGMCIALLRKIVPLELTTRECKDRAGFNGIELSGKTVGIVGMGAIGTKTAKLFQAFGCNVLAWSRTAKKIDGINFVSLENLLSNSDIISLHIPANSETKDFINKETLNLINQNAVIINTARGQIVNTCDVLEALKSGKLAAYATDVYETEPPLISNHPLFDAPNTLLLPHIAYASKESMQNRIQIVKRNIESFLEGKLQNRVL